MIRELALATAFSLLPAAASAQDVAPLRKPAAKTPAKPAPAKAAKTKPAAKPALAAVVANATGDAGTTSEITDHASKGDFGVLQVSAPDARQFVGAWALGTASKATSTTTVADKPLFVFIIFHGCKAGADGKCDVTADFAIHRPDGSIDEDHKDMAIWKRAPADDPEKSVLGDGALGFGTDSEGPFGEYRIVATVTDKVAGIALTTAQVLTVTLASEMPVATAAPPASEDAAPASEPAPPPAAPGKPRTR